MVKLLYCQTVSVLISQYPNIQFPNFQFQYCLYYITKKEDGKINIRDEHIQTSHSKITLKCHSELVELWLVSVNHPSTGSG